jgi:hypothetical protein
MEPRQASGPLTEQPATVSDLMVVCCWAAPTLLAGGVLVAIVGFLGNRP